MMRRQQHVGRQRCARAHEQLALLRRLDIAGQQDRVLAGRDFHGAAAGIRFQGDVVMGFGQRMQHLEMHAFPAPALARHAAQVRLAKLALEVDGRVAIGQGGRQPSDGHVFQQGDGAARVVGVTVGNDQAIDLADAACTQIRHDDPAGAVGIEAVGRARVLQQAMCVRFHQQGHALAHVEGGDP